MKPLLGCLNNAPKERGGCLKREADVFLTKFNFIKRRLCFGNFKSFRNISVV